MTKFTNSINFAEPFSWMAIFVSLVLPAICLDYIFTEPKLGQFTVPHGQYIFFVTTVLSAGILVFRLERNALLNILSDKIIWIFSGLFLTGFFLSSPSIWGIRLLCIIASSSLAIIIIATFIHQSEQKWQPIIGLLLLLPFALPVFAAFFLELTGAINFGVVFENYKHLDYPTPRWHFLYSSANGFGFSAAFTTVALYLAFFMSAKATLKIIFCLLGLVACYALILSGTRAAYIFVLASIFAFHIFSLGLRPFLWILGAMLLSFLIIVVVVGLEEISLFLRIDGLNLQTTSSSRWNAMTHMWEILSSSPIYGLGFGAADNNFPVYPSNIFYFALPLEIGVIGFIGVIGIFVLPGFHIIKQILFKKRMTVITSKSYLSVLSVCVLAGFLPYLIFEFNVLRVSAVNQLFFFCWATALLEFSQKHNLN